MRCFFVCQETAFERERELTLDRAIEIGIVNELSDRDNTELSNLPAVHKDEIHSVGGGKKSFLIERSIET